MIKGFWHILATPVGQQIAAQQYQRLLSMGLRVRTEAIHIGVAGAADPAAFAFDAGCQVHHSPDPTVFEFWTLEALWRDAQALPAGEERYYWYIHTKGATWGSPVSSWRHAMETCVIDNHVWCTTELARPEIGSAGPLLHFNPHPFYAGNFFWAKASYVRHLASPLTLLAERKSRGLPDNLDRFVAEEWIAQGIIGRSEADEQSCMSPFSRWTGQQP